MNHYFFIKRKITVSSYSSPYVLLVRLIVVFKLTNLIEKSVINTFSLSNILFLEVISSIFYIYILIPNIIKPGLNADYLYGDQKEL